MADERVKQGGPSHPQMLTDSVEYTLVLYLSKIISFFSVESEATVSVRVRKVMTTFRCFPVQTKRRDLETRFKEYCIANANTLCELEYPSEDEPTNFRALVRVFQT